MTLRSRFFAALFGAAVSTTNLVALAPAQGATPTPMTTATSVTQVRYGTVKVDELNIAYREAGDRRAQARPAARLAVVVASVSRPYRRAAPRFHVIAPDYQGFGNSDRPDPATFGYFVRSHLGDDREVSRRQGLRPLRPLHAGLRRAGRLPDRRSDAEGAGVDDHPEHQCLQESDSRRPGMPSARRCGSTGPRRAKQPLPRSTLMTASRASICRRGPSRTDQPGRLGIGRRVPAAAQRHCG